MNDSKYGRLYPERAVEKARKFLEKVVAGTHWIDAEEALTSLDEFGFPPDEPLFLLRGQDELAADIVRDYANARIRHEEETGQGDEATHLHLYEFADRMAQWRPRKFPD